MSATPVINCDLENALKELDQSTNALLEADRSDVVAICQALERRADAITKLAFLADEAVGTTAVTLGRLSAALARGEQATRRALNMKPDAIEEWTRLNQILRAQRSASHS